MGTVTTGQAQRSTVDEPYTPAMVGDGANGWSPLLVGENDGTRSLIKVADWMGGSGAKPPTGYVGPATATTLVTKAQAFNFNSVKRVDIFTGVTAANGVATIAFDPAFATIPAKALPMAGNNLLGGIVNAEIVAGSLTKSGCQVKVTQKALLTGVVAALAGSSVAVIAIEA